MLLYLITILVGIGTFFFIYKAFQDPLQASGWVQVALVFVGMPVILFQIYEIRKDLNKEPKLDVGIASIDDYPISNIKNSNILKSKVDVSSGYAHFLLAVRNNGKNLAKNIKIFLEFTETNLEEPGLRYPKLKISEFSKDKKGFVSENNADFTFVGGADFSIYPGDTDTFGFDFTTVINRTDHNGELHPDYPEPCICFLKCIIWAEGLVRPISKNLEIHITQLDRDIGNVQC